MSSTSTLTVKRGIVKQIKSGDYLVIREQPKSGPPPETLFRLTNVIAPKVARREIAPNIPGSINIPQCDDEPYGWEAREFLRQKLIGKEVAYTVEYKAQGRDQEFGFVYLGKDTSGENVTESLIKEGLVQVQRGVIRPNDENQQKLVQLEDLAKAAKKGVWADGTGSEKIRQIMWNVDNPRFLVDSHHNKPIDAIIENCRDGCTVRAFLLPSFQYVTVMFTGIKCPMARPDDAEPPQFAAEAKFFVESRLLQRDVQIILEGVSNQNLIGTVLHPYGNITELLLKEGYARCVDWSMGMVTTGAEKLRAAEKYAKDNKKRLWKDYIPSICNIASKDKSYVAKVVEIVNGDALNVLGPDGRTKIFLSSLKPPRLPATDTPSEKRVRPLYDVPYMFEAREFLRKKLINKKVNVQVDYVQPASQGYPEKTCCTVVMAGINIADTLISKGLATVIRHRQDDDQRSACYDTLLAAETQAMKKMVGVHSKKDRNPLRVAELAGDVSKAKQFLPFLQRAGRVDAIVEFVASGSRLRLYVIKENCLITFLLSGIECPRGARPVARAELMPSEPYGEEALQFTKEACLQRDVQVEVEGIDRGGNFIGWLFLDGVNQSVALVEEGLSRVHFTAERSAYYKPLCSAQEKAKQSQINTWKDYEEPKEEEVQEEVTERKISYKSVVVTEVCGDFSFYVQMVDNGTQLEKLMEQMRHELEMSPPLTGAYTPKKNDQCAAKFVDGVWYRAKVEKVEAKQVNVLYIDYGNKDVVDSSSLAALPGAYKTLPAQAYHYQLAAVTVPNDHEEAVEALHDYIGDRQFLANSEYKSGNTDFVTLVYPETKEDVSQLLISEGYVLAENRTEKRLQSLVADYMKAQDKAKTARLHIWRYGDFRADDAKEFGYST